jgi:hypothetical protein
LGIVKNKTAVPAVIIKMIKKDRGHCFGISQPVYIAAIYVE